MTELRKYNEEQYIYMARSSGGDERDSGKQFFTNIESAMAYCSYKGNETGYYTWGVIRFDLYETFIAAE